MEFGITLSRRQMLLAAGPGITVSLAGCTGGDSPSDNENSDPSMTDTATPTQGKTPTTTQTSDPATTTTSAEFSSEGDDSVLIEKSPKQLTLTKADLPGDGWTGGTSVTDETDSREVWRRSFKRETAEGTVEQIINEVQIWNKISQAKHTYDRLSLSNHAGGISEPDKSQELSIGVESEWSFAQAAQTYFNYLRIRDANAFSYIDYIQESGDEDFTPAGLQETGSLGVVVHQKWR